MFIATPIILANAVIPLILDGSLNKWSNALGWIGMLIFFIGFLLSPNQAIEPTDTTGGS